MSRIYRASELDEALYDRMSDLEKRLDELEEQVECQQAEIAELKKGKSDV